MTDPATNFEPNRVTAVIPCYNAGARLRPVAEGVRALGVRLIIVDDGCTDSTLATLEGLDLQIESHAVNRGKGHAILTGLRAALALPETEAVCLLDADGQHDPRELPRLCTAQANHDASLVIGARVFDGGHVPLRSRIGNKVTATVSAALLGRRLPDTQSGYRVLARHFAASVLDTVAGGRYETEMEIIVKAVREGLRLVSEPIQTLYEEDNPSSHFHKLRDSWLIYRRLFTTIRRYPSRN